MTNAHNADIAKHRRYRYCSYDVVAPFATICIENQLHTRIIEATYYSLWFPSGLESNENGLVDVRQDNKR